MASKLLESVLYYEEPLASKPGFKGRSTIQEIDANAYAGEGDDYMDETDAYLGEKLINIYEYLDQDQYAETPAKCEALCEQILHRLLPLSIPDLHLWHNLAETEDPEIDKVYYDCYQDKLHDAYGETLKIIRDCFTGQNLFISLSFSARSDVNTIYLERKRKLKFLNIYLGTVDDYHQFLIGSYYFDGKNFKEFLVDSIKISLEAIWPKNLWIIQAKQILMIIHTTEIQLEQDWLEEVHPNLRSVLILPCLSHICSQIFPKLEPKFQLLRLFHQHLEAFLCKEQVFFDLFIMDFPEFFSVDCQNYFELVNFYGLNYWQIRGHIAEYCMPGEKIHNMFTAVLTPEHLHSLFESASMWQSLVNISLLIKNYWFFPHSEYSAQIIALELENIKRHGGANLCPELERLDVDKLVLLSRFFNEHMPLVPATIQNQAPLCHKMLEDLYVRCIGADDGQAHYEQNLMAIVYTAKEILYDYDINIRDDKARFQAPALEGFSSPYEDFGHFELNESSFRLSDDSVDDSHLDVIRALHQKSELADQEQISPQKSADSGRKRRHSLVMF